MNINGEYTIKFNIYTMFHTYTAKITNHNIITNNGYEFFIKKWFDEEKWYQTVYYGYLNKNDNKFYGVKNIDDTFDDEIEGITNIIYIDKSENGNKTYKQYIFDGEKYISFIEQLSKVCIGNASSTSDGKVTIKPSVYDTDLYSLTYEYDVKFTHKINKLSMTYDLTSDELNNSTEIGVKTNHGRLVSHDIHHPYNLPEQSNITLEYVFKLGEEEISL